MTMQGHREVQGPVQGDAAKEGAAQGFEAGSGVYAAVWGRSDGPILQMGL